MSLQQLLGLELFGLSDEEIMKRIDEAHKNQMKEIEFTSSSKRVTLRFSGVNMLGLSK